MTIAASPSRSAGSEETAHGLDEEGLGLVELDEVIVPARRPGRTAEHVSDMATASAHPAGLEPRRACTPRRVYRRTLSQSFDTASPESAKTMSLPGPQTTTSWPPWTTLMRSLPGPPSTRSGSKLPKIVSWPGAAEDPVRAAVAGDAVVAARRRRRRPSPCGRP